MPKIHTLLSIEWWEVQVKYKFILSHFVRYLRNLDMPPLDSYQPYIFIMKPQFWYVENYTEMVFVIIIAICIALFLIWLSVNIIWHQEASLNLILFILPYCSSTFYDLTLFTLLFVYFIFFCFMYGKMYYGNHTVLQVHSTSDGNSAYSVHSDSPGEDAAQSKINCSNRPRFFPLLLNFSYCIFYFS